MIVNAPLKPGASFFHVVGRRASASADVGLVLRPQQEGRQDAARRGLQAVRARRAQEGRHGRQEDAAGARYAASSRSSSSSSSSPFLHRLLHLSSSPLPFDTSLAQPSDATARSQVSAVTARGLPRWAASAAQRTRPTTSRCSFPAPAFRRPALPCTEIKQFSSSTARTRERKRPALRVSRSLVDEVERATQLALSDALCRSVATSMTCRAAEKGRAPLARASSERLERAVEPKSAFSSCQLCLSFIYVYLTEPT